jgi:hypothetical protein
VPYIYDTNNYKLHLPTVDMHWYTLIDSFMYKIPMHRKKVRLQYFLLHTLWCALLCFRVLDVFIGMITPWDPGILSFCTFSNDDKDKIKKRYFIQHRCPY